MWNTIFMFMLIYFAKFTIGYEITQISAPKIKFATCPVWDPLSQSVLFVEFAPGGPKKIIFRYSYQDNAVYSASVPSTVKACSFIYPTNQRGLYVISNLNEADLIRWDGQNQRTEIVRKIVTVGPNNSEDGITCAAADPLGRFYIGEYAPKYCNTAPTKSLYRYTLDSGLKRLAGGFYGSTGLVFSEDGCKAYHLDFCTLQIIEFDVDLRTGNFYNRSVVFDFHSIGIIGIGSKFTPSSLALDINGLLYTTDYGRNVYQIDPRTKRIVQTIDMGISGIAGLTFGGPKRDILFVTASSVIINSATGQVVQNITYGTSLYAVTGLCATGVRVSNLDLSKLVPLNNYC